MCTYLLISFTNIYKKKKQNEIILNIYTLYNTIVIITSGPMEVIGTDSVLAHGPREKYNGKIVYIYYIM